jgi:ABC-type transport system substrate-binding protein
MSATFDRRSFLTHSAATVGGIAMAGSVVDGLLADAANAGVLGVATGKPKRGGTLNVGIISDAPNNNIFSGSFGKMDASGFCIANAVFDPLFKISPDGSHVLPNLALSATPNSNYTQWTIALRQGVTFHNGDPFNADVVVTNWEAANADQTVGLAIQPIIRSVAKVDNYTVVYTMVVPFNTFPFQLAESQICYIANWPNHMDKPTQISSSYTGNPIGTGPFQFKSWSLQSQSQWTANPKYWKKDAAGRQLPYLSGITFKVIPDSNSRNQALQSGSVDMIVQQDNPSIGALKGLPGISYRTDQNDRRSPSVNCLLMNTSGTLNQYFAWYGYFAGARIPGTYPYLKNGQSAPAAVQRADATPAMGAVDPQSLKWNTNLKPVVNDPNVRKALAMAIDRQAYHSALEGGVGTVANGLYSPHSPFYSPSGYPSYNPKGAKALISAYKKANNLQSVSFVVDYVAGDTSAQKRFAFFQQAFSKIGVSIQPRPLVQSDLINNVIYGQFDCASWNQFGGNDPADNYVWFLSLPASAPLASGGLGMNSLSPDLFIPGAVNFGHQGDATVERSMLAAMAAKPGSAASVANWQAVNRRMSSAVIPYLYLDYTLTAWAVRNNVQNWATNLAGDGHTRAQQFNGGSASWEAIWKK